MQDGLSWVTISRCESNCEPSFITIDIRDQESREIVAELKLSLEDFARAITSQVITDIPFRYGDLSKIGQPKE